MAESNSIANRAETGEHEELEEELFPMGAVSGDGVTLKTFVKAGKENKLAVKLKAARVPSGSGLADPEKDRTLLVTCEPGKVETIPHKEDGKVVGYTTAQVYTPIYVEGVQRGDAGRLEAAFKELLADDPKGAAQALDGMQRDAAVALG